MTRDQFLTEWLGECWHEWQGIDSRTGRPGTWSNGVDDIHLCLKCGKKLRLFHDGNSEGKNDFSTWLGFGKLWEAAQKDQGWDLFTFRLIHPYTDSVDIKTRMIYMEMINPDHFASAWAKFKGWKE